MIDQETAYRLYAQSVYRYLLSLTRNRDLAEELTQETFFRAIRASERYDESCSLSTWLFAIAKNVHREYLRKHPPNADMDSVKLASPSAEESFFEQEDGRRLLARIHSLPEPYREVIQLRALGGLSFRDIGSIFGNSENWARVTFFRGKERLRKELRDGSD